MQYPDKLKGGFDAPRHQNSETRAHRGLRIGSLCTGYGGLDAAIQRIFGATLSWVADSDRHVSKLLGARFAGVPNLGDISRIDWRRVEPVDIVCAGFPCQDISYAGRGAGIAHCVRNA
jgi:DNA (cytosine-5)-methyltransferase 1